ncbi:MAG: Uma2 family endonuclease [Bryobacteraceae bacterium]|nr:Uma2 family endonuclease [Bryobacteraceae bacterium]
MVATKTLMTIAELERLPAEDGVRYELDGGDLVRMTFPKPRHNLLVGRIYRILLEFAERTALGIVYPSDTGYVLSRDPDTLRGPDVTYLPARRASLVDPDQHIEGAPDLAVEVVSPSDSAEDLDKKVKQYLAAGGHTVWIVYPLTRTVQVYQADGGVRQLTGDQILEAPELLPGFAVPVSRLFEA